MTLLNHQAMSHAAVQGYFLLKTEAMLKELSSSSAKPEAYNQHLMRSNKMSLGRTTKPALHKRIGVLQNEDSLLEEKFSEKTSLVEQSVNERVPPLHDVVFNSNAVLSRRVKVSLHAKSAHPYLLIFNSDDKFALPKWHLKLEHYDVSKNVDTELKLNRRREAAAIEDLNLNLGKLDNITLEASSSAVTDQWSSMIIQASPSAIKLAKKSPRRAKRLRVSLPALQESDFEEDVQNYPSGRKTPKSSDCNKSFSISISASV